MHHLVYQNVCGISLIQSNKLYFAGISKVRKPFESFEGVEGEIESPFVLGIFAPKVSPGRGGTKFLIQQKRSVLMDTSFSMF